jgi:RNA recognition motif-containing protein
MSAMPGMPGMPGMAANPYTGYTAAGSQAVEGVTKHSLFVYNLSTDSSEVDLYSLFGKFGAIVDVHIQRDLQTGAAKGFGFVCFAEYEQATQAIQAMDGYMYEKNGYKPLQVKFKNRK